MSDCLQPHRLKQTRLLQEFSQTHVHWVGDAIKPFCPLFPPYLHDLNVSQHHGLFQWVCSLHHVANTGASASASVLSMNIQCWFLSGLISLIPLLSKGLPRFFSRTTDWKHQIFGAFSVFMVQLSHPYVTNGKTIVHLKLWTDFVSKVRSLLFNTLFRLVKAFLPRAVQFRCSVISDS